MLERNVPRLAVDDRKRADAIRDPRERRHRLTAYTALRILLERIAGPGVRGRAFVRSAGGKPRLDAGGAEFSLSHIEGLALIGVSSALPPRRRPRKGATRNMAPRRIIEISAIGAGLGDKPLPALGSERAFLQAWARLEAFTKARGRGLARTLADVGMRGQGRHRLSPADLEASARRIAQHAGLIVHDVKLLPALHGAVAAPRGTRPVRARTFPQDRAGIELLLSHRA